MTTEIHDLPFVLTRDLAPANLWSTTPSGVWARDCATGNSYADEMVSYVRQSGDHALLAHVVTDMTKGTNGMGGIETGFLTRLSEHLVG